MSSGEDFDLDDDCSSSLSEDSAQTRKKRSLHRNRKSNQCKKGKCSGESQESFSDLLLDDDYVDSEYEARLEAVDNLDDEVDTDFGTKMYSKTLGKLYDYQKRGCEWMYSLYRNGVGGILGDEMGLGKTCQLCAHFSSLSFELRVTRACTALFLIVCPPTVLHHWTKEMRMWAPKMRTVVLHNVTQRISSSRPGTTDSEIETSIRRLRSSRLTHSLCILVTYDGLRRHQVALSNVEWTAVCLDEGQKIRNPAAQATKACKLLPCYHRLILSGTPIQNTLLELWSLVDFVSPGCLGSQPTFQLEFCDPIRMGGYAGASKFQVDVAVRTASALQRLIKPLLLRRRKEELAHITSLPKKTEHILFCRLSPEQRKLYEEIVDSKDVERIIRLKKVAFGIITTLRKLCNHPVLAFRMGTSIWEVRDPDRDRDRDPDRDRDRDPAREPCHRSGKLIRDGLEEEEEEEEDIESSLAEDVRWEHSGKLLVLSKVLPLWFKEGHKVLLFSQTQSMLNLTEKLLRESFQFKYSRLDGSTPVSKRAGIIHRFNNDPSMFMMLLTTRTGGVGISLTAANRVIILDPDWNPQTDMQARERVWRLGQTREVTIYRLVTKGTIEEKIYQRQISKVILSNRILENSKQLNLFSRSTMKELFALTDSGEVWGETTDCSLPSDGTVLIREVQDVEKTSGLLDQLAEVNSADEISPSRTTTPSNEAGGDRKLLLALLNGEAISSVYDHGYFEQIPERPGRSRSLPARVSVAPHIHSHPTVSAASHSEPTGVQTSSSSMLENIRSRQSLTELNLAHRQDWISLIPTGCSIQTSIETRLVALLQSRRTGWTSEQILDKFGDLGDQHAVLFRDCLRTVAKREGGVWIIK